jgi:hypothetical protein
MNGRTSSLHCCLVYIRYVNKCLLYICYPLPLRGPGPPGLPLPAQSTIFPFALSFLRANRVMSYCIDFASSKLFDYEYSFPKK